MFSCHYTPICGTDFLKDMKDNHVPHTSFIKKKISSRYAILETKVLLYIMPTEKKDKQKQILYNTKRVDQLDLGAE